MRLQLFWLKCRYQFYPGMKVSRDSPVLSERFRGGMQFKEDLLPRFLFHKLLHIVTNLKISKTSVQLINLTHASLICVWCLLKSDKLFSSSCAPAQIRLCVFLAPCLLSHSAQWCIQQLIALSTSSVCSAVSAPKT